LCRTWRAWRPGRACIEETAERIDAGEGSLNTEGAIAKYMATEAGIWRRTPAYRRLAATAIRTNTWWRRSGATCGITTIYEGTSEIMEMTISRDRWQLHLKTRGDHYHEQARQLEALDARHRMSARASRRSGCTRSPR
jgi:alkylation response protein AidB-like acyl-CoA dehydrogenase